jgi:hypothetical protein
MKIRPTSVPQNPPADTPKATTQAHTASTPAAENHRVSDHFQQALADNTRTTRAVTSVSFAEATQGIAPADWGTVSIEDRQQNLKDLQGLAHRLRDQGMPGVEIWGALRSEAVSRYTHTDLSPQRQADFVMQDIAVVTVGKDALKYLEQYEGLPRIGKIDPLVKTFQSDWLAMGLPPADNDWEAAGWAGNDLDTHIGQDFRPEINDKTKNQIFHTMFYEMMGYVTQDDLLIRAGSIVHEVRDGVADGGISTEDHNASYVGTAMGKAFRKMREGEHTQQALQQWGALTLAGYGKGGGPQVRAGKASPEAQHVHEQMTKKLKNKNLLWQTENLFIQGVDQLNTGFQRLKALF